MATDIPPFQPIPPERVREMLASGIGQLDPELAESGRCDAYRLPEDKLLLVIPDGNGRLFQSRTEVLHLAKEWTGERRHPTHVMAEWLPRGPEFVTDVMRLAGELAGQLEEELGGTSEGLDAVDGLVRRRGADVYLEREQFLRLLAYVGELVRHRVEGNWCMVHTADDRIWEPWIVEPSGYRHQIFALLLGQLRVWGTFSSLRRAIEHDLKIAQAYAALKPHEPSSNRHD
ncbi:MAG TPA: hypothetical protein VGB75_12015 [Jatrophihabitans sp.]|jgi:hypothetical protein|uniref:hypothetical protein n=1 Tax=Jatrophihabitans sp. TaxID=1932789 RepID=UPI002F0B6972